MSTAIALQDMNTTAGEHSTMRQRANPKSSTTSSTPSREIDSWLATPHSTDLAALPLDASPLSSPTVYWISPHSVLTKNIKILDLTQDMCGPYSGMTDAYKASIKRTLKDHSHTSAFTCHRDHWLGLKHHITDASNNSIATWSHPWSSVGEATLTFPPDSPHASHPVKLRNKTWGLRTESFTLNSQPFVWQADSLWHSTNMTLYKVVGSHEHQRKVEVGKYAQKWWGGFVTGGTFVVDTSEVDGVVACLTLCVVLKKKRQRAAERHSGGE